MSAHIVSLTSRLLGAALSGSAKTLVAAALCRWLYRDRHPVCPFALSPAPDPRALHVLACAAGLLDSLAPSGGASALAAQAAQWECIVVDCAPEAGPPPGPRFDLLAAAPSGFEILDTVSGETLPAPWLDPASLFPAVPPEVERLPEWTFRNAPRVGIVSLPHLSNFADFRLVRNAEWIALAPPGLFHMLILPASSDELFDRRWLAETGLDAWLERQREQGCSILCVGSSMFPGRPFAAGALRDFRVASLALGRRLPPPEPPESEIDALADWIESWAGANRLRDRCLGS